MSVDNDSFKLVYNSSLAEEYHISDKRKDTGQDGVYYKNHIGQYYDGFTYFNVLNSNSLFDNIVIYDKRYLPQEI